MTTLETLFHRDINRSIDSVVKADDLERVEHELEEYVITDEIKRNLEVFFEAYNSRDGGNGVWISGFFGSGKSHLLKMLALLLEDHKTDKSSAREYFLTKAVDLNEPTLKGHIEKATSRPSQSILFNIDQKATVIAKTETDALLGVFQKVFDEHCGYFGKNSEIAQLERDLDQRGQLQSFKDVYQSVAGKPWERGREQPAFEGANVDRAYAQVSGHEARDILKQYRTDTKISIEDFAHSVKAWLDARNDPKFRLNFFADEVGQYIANNVKLMTNLQTIAESLKTVCNGRAWIVVTAQQSMSDVVGEMTKDQSHDFSKIQARFNTRMPLQSADVEEVIQRRLLEKTPEGVTRIGSIYDAQKNSLRTLFDFTDLAYTVKQFKDRDAFVRSYPFPLYQYDLFQRAIEGLSAHGVFEGKYSSVGERSMLVVFQDVAQKVAKLPLGQLATFDKMYDGIAKSLKSTALRNIRFAQNDLPENSIAIQILKVLFLVKYVTEFKATSRNIDILLLDSFDVELGTRAGQIEDGLAKLEARNVIQRNGEVYEFLTNEEMDIETEIKELEIDGSEMQEGMVEALYGGPKTEMNAAIGNFKSRYIKTGHEYPMARKLGGHLVQGRDHELSLNFVESESPEQAKAYSLADTQMCILLDPDPKFAQDLRLYLQTEKFCKQAQTSNNSELRAAIIAQKRGMNTRRASDLATMAKRMVAQARLFIMGSEIEINGDDPADRLTRAFQEFVEKVYRDLPMLGERQYNEKLLQSCTQVEKDMLEGAETDEAEREILTHVRREGNFGRKVYAKTLHQHFERAPYGWPWAASLFKVGQLVTKGKLEARLDGNLLADAHLVQALTNSRKLDQIQLVEMAEYTPAQIRKSKAFYSELFGVPSEAADAKTLGQDWKDRAEQLNTAVQDRLAQTAKYPFVKSLEPGAKLLAEVASHEPKWFLEKAHEFEHDLLDFMDDFWDHMVSFFSSAQRDIYDDARDFLAVNRANAQFVDDGAVTAIQAALDDPQCYRGCAIQDMNQRFIDLKRDVQLKVDALRTEGQTALDSVQEKVQATPAFQALDDTARAKVTASFDDHKTQVVASQDISTLRLKLDEIKRTVFTDAMNTIEGLTPRVATPAPMVPTADGNPVTGQSQGNSQGLSQDQGAASTGVREMPQSMATGPKYVQASTLSVSFDKAYLETESDVDAYLNALKTQMVATVRAGNKVTV